MDNYMEKPKAQALSACMVLPNPWKSRPVGLLATGGDKKEKIKKQNTG
jgi:hypothetical protein